MLLLTPILMYICMSYVRYDIVYIYSALTYTICKYVNMGVKRTLGPQECSQPFNIFYTIVFRVKNNHYSFVFFRISFVYFMVLGQSGFAA